MTNYYNTTITPLRWQILSVLVLSSLSAITSIIYQVMRSIGQESEILRNVASVTSTTSWILIIILLVLIFNYRKKDE